MFTTLATENILQIEKCGGNVIHCGRKVKKSDFFCIEILKIVYGLKIVSVLYTDNVDTRNN